MLIQFTAALMSLAWSAANPAVAAAQSRRDPGCQQWQECRAMALAAAERGEYETFHDLAWRAVQTGPPKDPALMYLLARAQALSGRPHDALVMLDRLTQMNVASDAATNDDFVRTRTLPGWPDVAARIERLGAPSSSATSAPAAAPRVVAPVPAPRVPAPVTAAPPAVPAPATLKPGAAPVAAAAPTPRAEAVRFSIERSAIVSLAYDAVSRRFVFGDRLGRRLVVVSEGSNQRDDLVRADSAGFHDISAIEIDHKRGDLWVASAAAADGAGTLHRLQLVSGRPLKAFRIAPGAAPVNPVDLAITPEGAVLVLDAANGRILALRPGASSFETVARLDAPQPVSLAVGSEEGIAYVAHRDGISRIEFRGRTTRAVASPKDVSLARLQQIRWHRNALIGVGGDDGASRIVQFDLAANGRTVRRATTLAASAAIAGQASLTISGDDLFYLAPEEAEFVAYRVHLR